MKSTTNFFCVTIPHILLISLLCLIGSGIDAQPAYSSSVVSLQSSKKYTISGYIKDVATGETLIGASIYVNKLKAGAVTNAYGYYSLTLPAGDAILRISYVGYATKEVTVKLNRNIILSEALESGHLLDEVVITTTRTETGIRATQMGAESIPMQQIKSTPNMLGEADVMKTIQLVAGVQSGSDGSANLHVRGGAPDQNLILLDGTPLYKVDHAMGLFSIFPPEAVKSVTFFKSSFPARFGGRLSSVVDVRTNDGNMKEYHGLFSIGLLSSKISIEGPIIKDKTSFNINLRRTYADLLAKPFMKGSDTQLGYYFYDLNAKINHRFSDTNRLFINFYNGRDVFDSDMKEEDSDAQSAKNSGHMKWGNTVVTGRWNYLISPKLFSNITVAYNRYLCDIDAYAKISYDRDGGTDKQNVHSSYNSGIYDWSAKWDFDYMPSPIHNIKFGFEYLYHTYEPEVHGSSTLLDTGGDVTFTEKDDDVNNSTIYAHEMMLYAEDDMKVTDRWQLNLGLHASMFNVSDKTYHSIQPRISTRYQLAEHWATKASYTIMSQYVHLLSSSLLAMPTDLWAPVTEKIKPMKSSQYGIGAYYTGINGWEFSLESYYKTMNNVLAYKPGAGFLGSSENWADKVVMGEGRSIGLEMTARKTQGRTTGWINYTLAKSDRRSGDNSINNGKWYPYRYDIRHNFNIALTHKINDHWDVGASWNFMTGGAVTIGVQQTQVIIPSYDYYYNSDSPTSTVKPNDWQVEGVSYVNKRNNYRIPSSHRLNLSVNYRKKRKQRESIWNFSIYNVYCAMNPAYVYIDESLTNDGRTKRAIKKTTILPIIPSVTYTYKF